MKKAEWKLLCHDGFREMLIDEFLHGEISEFQFSRFVSEQFIQGLVRYYLPLVRLVLQIMGLNVLNKRFGHFCSRYKTTMIYFQKVTHITGNQGRSRKPARFPVCFRFILCFHGFCLHFIEHLFHLFLSAFQGIVRRFHRSQIGVILRNKQV